MCTVDVREGPKSLVMLAAVLQEISRERTGGGGVSPSLRRRVKGTFPPSKNVIYANNYVNRPLQKIGDFLADETWLI